MNEVDTYFAPAERLDNDEIYNQTFKILGLRQIIPVLEILPNMVAVLNEQRQVVYSNQAFTDAIDMDTFDEGLGQRPGELLACIHAHDHINGCGTGKACRKCGAVLTILEAQEDKKKHDRETKITVKKDGEYVALDLHVIASPINVDNEVFYMCVITNIGK